MRTVKYDVLVTISAILRIYGGNWCYASRAKLLELLLKHHSVTIGYRQLGNHLRDLRDAGLIKTYGRNYRRRDGTLCLLTAARCLTIKGCKYLIKRGVSWAYNHLAALRNKYRAPSPKRASNDLPRQEWVKLPKKSGQNPFLDPLHRLRLGLPPDPPFESEPA